MTGAALLMRLHLHLHLEAEKAIAAAEFGGVQGVIGAPQEALDGDALVGKQGQGTVGGQVWIDRGLNNA